MGSLGMATSKCSHGHRATGSTAGVTPSCFSPGRDLFVQHSYLCLESRWLLAICPSGCSRANSWWSCQPAPVSPATAACGVRVAHWPSWLWQGCKKPIQTFSVCLHLYDFHASGGGQQNTTRGWMCCSAAPGACPPGCVWMEMCSTSTVCRMLTLKGKLPSPRS